MSLHLYRKHISEVDVQETFANAKQSAERKLLLMKLTNRGNFVHNMKFCEKVRVFLYHTVDVRGSSTYSIPSM